MALEDCQELLLMLAPFPKTPQGNALFLWEFVWQYYPETSELIYDNFNALAFGWGLTEKLGDFFVSVAVYGGGVNLGFNRGTEFAHPEKRLQGNGNQFRFIGVDDIHAFPITYVEQLIADAWMNANARL